MSWGASGLHGPRNPASDFGSAVMPFQACSLGLWVSGNGMPGPEEESTCSQPGGPHGSASGHCTQAQGVPPCV